MSGGMASWWGFRLRAPLDADQRPLCRREAVSVGLLLATVLELLWWTWMVVVPPAKDPSFLRGLRDHVGVPLALLIASVALAWIISPSFLVRLRVGAWLVVARQRGQLVRWDMMLVAVALITAVLLLLGKGRGLFVPSAFVLASVALSSVALGSLPLPAQILTHRRLLVIPAWLRGKREDPIERKEIVPPDPDAHPMYRVTMRDRSYEVGIDIPEQALSELRALNVEAQGRLFQREPEAVVALDRPPAEGIGREEIIRLCRQILSIARRHDLTRLQLANLVLYFVQDGIAYRFDEDSTGDLPGGPYEEYGRFALETLHDSFGDCECTAILCTTLLAFLGFQTALLHVRVPDRDRGLVGHMAAGLGTESLFLPGEAVSNAYNFIETMDGTGRRFLYGETACDGHNRAFGGIPPDWKKEMVIEEVVPLPVLGV